MVVVVVNLKQTKKRDSWRAQARTPPVCQQKKDKIVVVIVEEELPAKESSRRCVDVVCVRSIREIRSEMASKGEAV